MWIRDWMMERLKNDRWLVVILGVCLIVRLGTLIWFEREGNDWKGYKIPASHLVWGHGYAEDAPGSSRGYVPSIARLPGYPLLLTAFYMVFGITDRPVQIFQGLLDCLACLLLYDLVLVVFRRKRMAQITALGYALCPYIAFFTIQIMAESVATFGMLLQLRIAVCLANRDEVSWKEWAVLGLIQGCVVMCRQGNALFFVWILLYVLARRGFTKEMIRPLLIYIGGMLFLFVPWTVRNAFVFERFIPLNNMAIHSVNKPTGLIDWIWTWSRRQDDIFRLWRNKNYDLALYPDLTFDSPGEEEVVRALFQRMREANDVPVDVDSRFAEIAEKRRKAHPGRHYLLNNLYRMTDFFLNIPHNMQMDHRIYKPGPISPFGAFLAHVPRMIFGNLWFLFALLLTLPVYYLVPLGAWSSRQHWQEALLFLSYPLYWIALSIVLGMVESRFIVPTYPCLLILATAGLFGFREARVPPCEDKIGKEEWAVSGGET